MSPEVALLSETWELVRNNIHISDRFDIASEMLVLFEEHVGLGDLEVHVNEFDRVMKAAIVDFMGQEEDGDCDLPDEW